MKPICSHTGKVAFETKTAAMRALISIKRSVRHKGPDGRRIKHRCRKPRQRRVYYCDHCSSYHLTKWSWWFWGSFKYVTDHLHKSKYFSLKHPH